MIQGLLTEDDRNAIARLAGRVPLGGVIVEVGSLFGLSASLWCNYSKASRIVCIDPWKHEPWMDEPQQGLTGKLSIEAFRANITDPRVETIRGYSPACANKWTDPIDLFWDDGDHSEKAVAENMEFWAKFLKPGGVICGHDYNNSYWPGVKKSAHELAALWNAKVECTTTQCGVWWMQKPQGV